MAPWIRKWGGVGFGVMGNQGAESIHAEFNRIEQRLNQRHDRVERLRVTDHLLKGLPSYVAADKEQKDRRRVTLATHRLTYMKNLYQKNHQLSCPATHMKKDAK